VDSAVYGCTDGRVFGVRIHTDNSLEMTHLSVRPVLTITLFFHFLVQSQTESYVWDRSSPNTNTYQKT